MRKTFCSLIILMISCSKSGEIEKHAAITDKYNPDKPLAITQLKPMFGGIDEPFVIDGNFPADTSSLKVYFGTKRAIIIATDGNSISGIVPKQPAGYNQVSVVVAGDSIVPDKMIFKYKQTKSVKTITGKFGDGADYVDGDINIARFREPSNIATVKGQKGDNIIVVESWWNDRVRLVSQDDNKVITISTGTPFGTPAVDHTREKFYVIGHFWDQHNIYSFSRADGWTARSTGIKISSADLPGDVFSCTLGRDDDFLYAMDGLGNMVSVDLKNETYKKLQLTGALPSRFDARSHIIYSKFHDCFFASFPQEAGIFKITNNNGVWKSEKYAGFNGTGSATGNRLKDAQFTAPYGMAVNEDGEIYVINRDAAFINRIVGDQVEIVAGKPYSWGQINGDPLDARFDSFQDIAVDFEGNFYIAGGWDRVIRKLSIE